MASLHTVCHDQELDQVPVCTDEMVWKQRSVDMLDRKCKNGGSTLRGGQCHQIQNGGEHRESNSGPLLPESRIIPLDHAPLTGGFCGEATIMGKSTIFDNCVNIK